MNKSEITTSSALPSQHAITGCDTVGKFNGISKEYWFKRFFDNDNSNVKLKHSLVEFQIEENLTEEIEKCISKNYSRTDEIIGPLGYIPAARYKLQIKKSFEGSKLPPPKEALQFHFNRAFYQLWICVTADKAQLDERDPNIYGWKWRNIWCQHRSKRSRWCSKRAPKDVVQPQRYLIDFPY